MPFGTVTRNPFEVFLLGLSLASTAPLLRGESGSAALEAALPDLVVIAWGVSLGFGSALALIGLWWRRNPWAARVLERAGLLMVATAALAYMLVILSTVDPLTDALYVAAVQTAYACACLWRSWQLTQWLGLASGRMRNGDGK